MKSPANSAATSSDLPIGNRFLALRGSSASSLKNDDAVVAAIHEAADRARILDA